MAYRKAGPKRTPAQRAADYAFERECDNAGMSHEEIAAELSRIRPYTITRQSVDTDFKHVFKMYRDSAVNDLAGNRQRDIEILEWLFRDLMRQWKRSCQDSKVQMGEEAIGPAPEIDPSTGKPVEGKGKSPVPKGKKRITVKGQCGDPAIAGRIVEVRARIAKLRGLDAPEKIEHAGKDGGPIQTEDKTPPPSLSVTKLRRIITALEHDPDIAGKPTPEEPVTTGEAGSARTLPA